MVLENSMNDDTNQSGENPSKKAYEPPKLVELNVASTSGDTGADDPGVDFIQSNDGGS